MLSYARPHWQVLIVGLLLTLLASGMALAQPLVAEAVVSALGAGESVARWVVLLAALVVVSALVSGFAGRLMSRTGERIVLTVRRGLISRMIRLRVGELDQHTAGDLTARVTSDSNLLRTFKPPSTRPASPSWSRGCSKGSTRLWGVAASRCPVASGSGWRSLALC